MFNDISCDGEGNEEECVANSKVVSILAKKFGNPEGWGPEGWNPEGWGPEGWGPEGWGPEGRARSTWANFNFGHRLFLLGPGAIWARPKIGGLSSTQARCNLGQFWLAPLTIQNVKMKKRKKKKGREKATKDHDN